MKKLQNISALFILAIFLLPGAAQWHLQHLIQHVQHNMQEKLEAVSLTTIRMPAADVRWEKPGKEIWTGNELFDVKTMVRDGQDLVFTGLFDKKEKELKQQRKKTEQETAGFSHFLYQSLQLYTNDAANISCQIPASKLSLPHHGARPDDHLYPGPDFDIPPPPPWFHNA